MKHFTSILLVLCLAVPVSVSAQDWDREKYPDYNPNFENPDAALMQFVNEHVRKPLNGQPLTRRKAKALAEAAGLPDHVDNASTKYFPPVFNQAGGSCGSASRICYMFTHEINAYRDINSSSLENNYPSHFVWLLTYGNSGKDAFVTYVGVPTSKTYGGRTYSNIYGNYDWNSEVFGWMQGYDKWFSAFGNRMTKPTTNPYSLGTEEGRLAAKAWLYNHAGDTTFHAGGLIGLGVASGGNWQNIPKTENNDRIGVTGMKYVKAWGTSVDHALTMVGYDDRIEFDIDGNGICGEEDKDEKGAWIIVNSWGGWCNGGFIYCPYAMGGPSVNSEGKLTGFWTGELYHTRKDYRPFRTIKLKMDYTRRSEMKLQCGISADLNATEPETVIDMHHFRYAGDGHSGETNPAPETPMLGKWADGKMHTEPMEFGYDLTDLTAGYDRNQPLKYFFIINTRDWGLGEGHIYNASIIDYELDREGVETPFDLGETGQMEIKSAGTKTVISVVVYGAALNAPQNLTLAGDRLTWDAPMTSGHIVRGYALYFDGKRVATTDAQTRQFTATETGTYSVTALYEGDAESAKVSIASTIQKQDENLVVNFKKGGFTIPDIFDATYSDCTIEFYIKPNSLSNYNNMFGPGWGTFYAHCNSNGTYSVGWDTGGHRIDASSYKLSVGNWTHMAIVVSKNNMKLYMGQNQAGSVTTNSYSGIGGFGNLVFISGGNDAQDASYDEIRIWNRARTAAEIKGTQNREFFGEVMPEGLLAYYKGDVIEIDGQPYLRDCVGGHHAPITNDNFVAEAPEKQPVLYRPKDTENSLSIAQDEEVVYAGVPVGLTAVRNDGIRTLIWNVPALGITDWHIANPSLTFPKAGTYEVSVKGYDYEEFGTGENPQAREITATKTITVLEPLEPDASFTMTTTEVASGDRVSFHVTNPITGFAYKWSMPGADVEEAGTLSAGATYQASGTYTITLTATSPSGKTAEEKKQIVVNEVLPVADFTVSDPVIMKGESVDIASTSKHHPTDFQWTLDGTVQKTIVNNADHFRFTTEEPGVYNVTLKASNQVGSNSLTQNRAVIVTNADSQNGLSFTQNGSKVTMQNPIIDDATTQKLTIEWWMNPAKLTSSCLGIGESTTTLMLRTDASGNMSFHNGSRTAKSGNGFVIEGQWHHYAVVFSKGAVKFFRDAELITSGTVGSTITWPETFSIGTSAADMTGSIDEFRIWNNTLTSSIFKDICNQPMEDPEYYITGEKASWNLRLYYRFNQTGGDVQDATSRGNTGIRSGFGPDGDAWDLSKGVFCLNFGEKKDDIILDGIETIDNGQLMMDNTRMGTYDISGRRISGTPKPGLYIINGRKQVIK